MELVAEFNKIWDTTKNFKWEFENRERVITMDEYGTWTLKLVCTPDGEVYAREHDTSNFTSQGCTIYGGVNAFEVCGIELIPVGKRLNF